MRLGYEIRTAVRFGEHEGRPSYRRGIAQEEPVTRRGGRGEDVGRGPLGRPGGGEALATLTYGHAATLWRINLGWLRRKNKSQYGFVLDIERGYWEKNDQTADDPDDPLSPRTERVIPYVEDRRNCMLFEPGQEQSPQVMASLQAILKSALQVKYQLEDNELAVEPLPNDHDRKLILLYESAEGGAGVLRRLLDEPDALAEVAREALRLCHFDPETGANQRRALRAQEDCEAACYDCLMNYYNQREHRLLDRQAIREILLSLARSRVLAGPTEQPRSTHLEQLMRLAGSELERSWLRLLEEHSQRLPSHAQHLIESCATRPDFYYQEYQAAIYIDGHYHDYAERRKRDEEYTDCLEDLGYTVLRFAEEENWDEKIARYPHIFGRRT
jgi:very-short-patch-repair endonuclease